MQRYLLLLLWEADCVAANSSRKSKRMPPSKSGCCLLLFLLLLLLSGRLNYIIDSFFPPQHFIGLKIIWIGRHRNIYMQSRKMTNKVESYILVSFVCNSAKQLQNEIRSILTLEPCKLYHYYYCCVAECIEKRSKDFFFAYRLSLLPHRMFQEDICKIKNVGKHTTFFKMPNGKLIITRKCVGALGTRLRPQP